MFSGHSDIYYYFCYAKVAHGTWVHVKIKGILLQGVPTLENSKQLCQAQMSSNN